MELQELEAIIERTNHIKKNQKKRENKLKDIEKWVERLERKVYKEQSRTIRSNEQNKKKITSIGIHSKNQKIIQELQTEAMLDGFFLSKENIINMGLQSLHKELKRNGKSIHDLFMKYK